MTRRVLATLVSLIAVSGHSQQLSTDPFPPIEANVDVIAVNYVDFATIPNDDGQYAPRLMHMVTESGTQRLYVSNMIGILYGMGYDGQGVTPYLDLREEKWGVRVMSAGNERGLQSFVFHPQFGETGTPGYGKFYTYVDSSNTDPEPDYVSGGDRRTHDLLLLEWTAANANAATYDGAAPREVFRAAQPFPNHNGGQIAFNPLSTAGDDDFGLLYVGLADGGSGGDPLNVGQNMQNYFGKILRIDPLGSDGPNGEYDIPASNPFVDDDSVLDEIYASGVRNPQRLAWDSADGRLLLADIGQNQVEEITEVPAGGNLGWNVWEGSYRYVDRQVDLSNPRSDDSMVWPIAEYDHADPLLVQQVAVSGLSVYRDDTIPALQNKIVFGDNPSGELFYVDADLENGGSEAIRRILLKTADGNKTLLQIVQAQNAENGDNEAVRVDMRFGAGPNGEIFLLNKHDGVVRMLTPE
ncbi:MAG: hypothetical protein A3H44_09735 [Gammaproteobacteria bacterium RIFCSPLOWO2_02_FULL_57_10]|nr:MAG: hypothetical protein A3H44_09735 [Gammaproteobacteria bacterium RIFCSPLOWO2_02_FULL_57_10]